MAGPDLPPPPKLGGGAPPGAGGMPSAGPGAGPPGASVAGPGAAGPMSAPMNTPEPMPGIEKAARVQVQIAAEMLQRELPHFPLDSEEFKALTGALKTVQGAFGKSKDEDRKLFSAEIMNMIGAVGPGSMSPGQKAMAGGSPPPGAPPPGAPPGAPPPGMPPAA